MYNAYPPRAAAAAAYPPAVLQQQPSAYPPAVPPARPSPVLLPPFHSSTPPAHPSPVPQAQPSPVLPHFAATPPAVAQHPQAASVHAPVPAPRSPVGTSAPDSGFPVGARAALLSTVHCALSSGADLATWLSGTC